MKKQPKKPLYPSLIVSGGHPRLPDMDRPFPIAAWAANRYMTAPERVELRIYNVKTRWRHRTKVKARKIGSDHWGDAYSEYFLSFNDARRYIIYHRAERVKRERESVAEEEKGLAAARKVPRMRKKEDTTYPPRPTPRGTKKAAKEAVA